MIVRSAIEQSLQPHVHPPYKQSHLWVSSVGGCPRSAMFQFLGYKKETEFPLSLREKFRFGSVLEDDTGLALKEVYGRELVSQVVLKDKIWSGKCDWGIRVGGVNPILVEHKTTGSKWWRKYGTPPNDSHIAQLVLYGQLYTEKYDAQPKLILYYRAWSNWAELELEDLGDTIKVVGKMDGDDFSEIILLNVTKSRAYLEKYFALQELPPYKKTDDCTFRGEPSCPFFNQCQNESKSTIKWGLF